VSLDVWTIGDAVLIQVGLQACDIRFEPVDIHNRDRRV
jgi:hypothetical protein